METGLVGLSWARSPSIASWKCGDHFQSRRRLALPAGRCHFPSMSTLADIEFAVTQLPRPDKAELLRFVAAQLRETPRGAGRTGAELARLWPALPHLTVEE